MVGFKVGDILKYKRGEYSRYFRFEVVQVTGTDIYIKEIELDSVPRSLAGFLTSRMRYEIKTAQEKLEHVTKLEKYLEWT
jgi:hypothetical protein